MTNDCKTCPVSTGTHKPAEALHQQIDEPQAEAMRLADECDESATHWVHEIDTRFKAAKMLRAQQARIAELEASESRTIAQRDHCEEVIDRMADAVLGKDRPEWSSAYDFMDAAQEVDDRIAELEAQLDAIGAGGVEPLRKPAAQAVQAAVPDDWRDQFSESVYEDLSAACNQDVPLEEYPARILNILDAIVGPRHPTVIKWRNDAIRSCIAIAYKYCSDPESYRYLKQDLEAMLAAPAHPAEGVPAQRAAFVEAWEIIKYPLPCPTRMRDDGSYADANVQDAWVKWQARAAFAATQPAAQGMDAEIQQAVEAERERICAAIKAEDDHCVDQGDYMLDSNDCIKIVRGKWVRPDYSLDAAQAKQGGA